MIFLSESNDIAERDYLVIRASDDLDVVLTDAEE